jgi:uncharacterized protein (TIGR02996 family)
MNQSDALRKAILDRPDDDSLRIAYADWLAENDDPEWADLIRVQVGLAHLPPFSPIAVRRFGYDARRRAPDKKQRELLVRHENEWLGPMAKAVPSWSWERGFLTPALLTSEPLRLSISAAIASAMRASLRSPNRRI